MNENKKENVKQKYRYSQYTTQYFHDILTHFRDVYNGYIFTTIVTIYKNKMYSQKNCTSSLANTPLKFARQVKNRSLV